MTGLFSLTNVSIRFHGLRMYVGLVELGMPTVKYCIVLFTYVGICIFKRLQWVVNFKAIALMQCTVMNC